MKWPSSPAPQKDHDGRRKKGPGPALRRLPPLAPEAAAALKDQVARVAAALDDGGRTWKPLRRWWPRAPGPRLGPAPAGGLRGSGPPNLPPLLAALFGQTG